jgi:hypothetical protein
VYNKMLFNFRFFSFPELISEISRVESPERYHGIRWFDLTDGWYWIEVGEAQLFRYTPEVLKRMSPPRSANGAYVDYYVGRLWRDMFELLPTILEPLPAPLAERLSSSSPVAWNDWLTDYYEWNELRFADTDDDEVDEEAVDVYHLVGDWWYHRRLDTGYLVAGPNIWFWSDGTTMHIGWDNRSCFLKGIPAWEALTGHCSLPLADFLAEITTFHEHFMALMAERVKDAHKYWTEPRFAQDLWELRRAQVQEESCSWLDHALRACDAREPTDWARVLAAIASIEEDATFTRLRLRRAHL